MLISIHINNNFHYVIIFTFVNCIMTLIEKILNLKTEKISILLFNYFFLIFQIFS